jgi:hypothetical protein
MLASSSLTATPVNALRRALRACDVSTVLDEVLVYLVEHEASFGSPLTLFLAHYDRMLRNKTAVDAAIQGAKSSSIPVHVMDVSSADMRAIHIDLLELRDKYSECMRESMQKDETIRRLGAEMSDLLQRNAALQAMGLSTRGEAKVTDDLNATVVTLQEMNSQLAEEYEILRRNVEFGFVADAQELYYALESRKSECDSLAATNTLLATALLHLQDDMKKARETLLTTTKELDLQQRRANLAEKELREHRAAENSVHLAPRL